MKLYWLDLETTGLDPNTTSILEVAVAEADFAAPFEYTHVYHSVVGLRDEFLDAFIVDMHTKNGLLKEAGETKKTIEEVEEDLLSIIAASEKREDRPILAGSSIHYDYSYLNVWMPKLSKRLSHRLYDVSAVKLFCQSIGMPPLPKAMAHRAKEDIEESIRHARECHKWLTNNDSL